MCKWYIEAVTYIDLSYKQKSMDKISTCKAAIESLTHWDRDKTAAISQMTFSNVFSIDENVWILLLISFKFVSKFQINRINNIPALVEIMAWRRPGNKPLSQPTMVKLLTHICVTRPQWVKELAAMLSVNTFVVIRKKHLNKPSNYLWFWTSLRSYDFIAMLRNDWLSHDT